MRSAKISLKLFMAVLLMAFFILAGQTFAGEKIDLNKADVKELQLLDGIGKTLAERIVDHRTSNGPFQQPEDIMKIKGIGKLKFEKIREQITVGSEQTMDH